MKKLGIMVCKKHGLGCMGTGCFRVFNEKQKYFERYKDEDIQMAAFTDCSGCDADLSSDELFLKKINSLKEKNITTVHIAACIGEKCTRRNDIISAFRSNGIEVVEGTH